MSRKSSDTREYLTYKTLAYILGMLPEPVIRRLGIGAGWMAWIWADRRKTLAIRNMARALGDNVDQPSSQTVRSARRMFMAYGRYWAEAFWVSERRIPSIDKHLQADGLEHYEKALADGRGAIFVLPHVGNWEVAGRAVAFGDHRLMAVAEKLGNAKVAEWFIELRRSLGIEIVLADRSAASWRPLEEVLSGNGLVALVTDRDINRSGVPTKFLDEETRLPSGAVRLSLRTGAPVIPVGSYFLAGRGHRVVMHPPLDLDEDVEAGVQKMADALGVIIRADPEQWHMVQANWPTDRRGTV